MTLRQKQSKFISMLGALIHYADQLGYELTGGDLWAKKGEGRPHKIGVLEGEKDSKHYQRLAIDLNLFIDGKYQKSSRAHRPLGLFWESMGGTWGGLKDGNHYEY